MQLIARAAAALATALFVVACSGSAATPAPTSGQPTAAPPTAAPPTAAPTTAAEAPCTDTTGEPTTVEADVAGFEWSPSTVNAKVGDVITWTNADSAPHGVGLDDNSCRMSSNMGGGQSRSLTFSVAGEFPFHCTVHPDMRGTLVITE